MYFIRITKEGFFSIFFISVGKPHAPRNCTLWNQTSESVEVSCVAGFDGGLPQKFLLEVYSSDEHIPRCVESVLVFHEFKKNTCPNMELTFRHFSPNTEPILYSFFTKTYFILYLSF